MISGRTVLRHRDITVKNLSGKSGISGCGRYGGTVC